MNKLFNFIQSFDGVKEAYISFDNAGLEKPRLVLSYEHRERDKRQISEDILVRDVPNLNIALSGQQARVLINAAPTDGLFEVRIELLGDEAGHFTIYNVPIHSPLVGSFAAYAEPGIEIEFRAEKAYLLEGVDFTYSFFREEYEMTVNGGFVDIDPAVALMHAALLNPGILDENKREH